jgi:DNA-binding CsgD family transcriptional regulator
MARATAMRSGAESRRISAVITATEASRSIREVQGPDLMVTALLAVLDVALDTLRVPALIVEELGEVVCSNAAARALTGGSGRVVRWSPAPANTSGRSEETWEVIPLAVSGWPKWSFVIWRGPDVPSRRRWKLTARQADVMHLVARGLTNASIADILGIRLGTVEFHISAIFDKVGVNNRAALIAVVMGG